MEQLHVYLRGERVGILVNAEIQSGIRRRMQQLDKAQPSLPSCYSFFDVYGN